MTAISEKPMPLGIIARASRDHLGPVLIALGGLVLLVYGMYIAAWFINTLVLTLLLALVISPILFYLRARGWPAWLAIVGGFLVVGGITLAMVGLAWISLSQMDENMPAYQARLAEITANLSARFNIPIPETSSLASNPDMGKRLLQSLVPLAFSAFSLIAGLVLYMFLLLYSFGEVFVMQARLRHLTGGNPVILEQLRRFGDDMRRFFTLNAAIGALAAAIDTVVLLMLGVDFALFWGLVSFVMSFIPNIGFIISMLGPALLALIQYGPREAVMVIIAYCVINMLVDYVLRPRIIGQDLNQSQIVTFLAVIVWGALLGPTGALLSVPLTLIAKLILEMATGTTQYSALIVEELPPESEIAVPVVAETPTSATG